MSPSIPLIDINKTKTILVIDPSASHLAYCLADLNKEKNELQIFYVGMLWTKSKWKRGLRFYYVQKCVYHLLNSLKDALPSAVYVEGFFANPKQMFGSAVIPTINGLIECLTVPYKVAYFEIPPPTWRSNLGIKPIKNSIGKRDYKVPTKAYVESILGKLPDEIPSNSNDKMRTTPSDIADVLAITIAIGKHHGLDKARLWGSTFYPKSALELFKKEFIEVSEYE